MLNIIIDTFGTMFFLMGLGLGLPAIAYEEKHPIIMTCLVVSVIVLGFVMHYFSN